MDNINIVVEVPFTSVNIKLPNNQVEELLLLVNALALSPGLPMRFYPVVSALRNGLIDYGVFIPQKAGAGMEGIFELLNWQPTGEGNS